MPSKPAGVTFISENIPSKGPNVPSAASDNETATPPTVRFSNRSVPAGLTCTASVPVVPPFFVHEIWCDFADAKSMWSEDLTVTAVVRSANALV